MDCRYEIRALVKINSRYEWYVDVYPNYGRAKKKFQYLKKHGAEFIELRVGFGRTYNISTIARYSVLEERS